METRKTSDLKTNGQVRQNLGDLTSLTASIKEHGIIVPLVINSKNEVIAGHRRLEAAKAAGLTEVPVTVNATKDSMAVQIIENTEREALDILEEGQAYKDYMDKHKCDEKTLSKVISKPTDYIKRRTSALKLSPEARKALREGEILIGHAELLGQMTKEQQKKCLQVITEYDLTVQNFSDQIRWMKKVDFGNLKFRPEHEGDYQTVLDSIGHEMDPKNDYYETLAEDPAFKKEVANYVESERQLLRDKKIPVFNSVEDLKKKHPDAVKMDSWTDDYKKAAKKLANSKTHAVVVDISYGDIGYELYRLEKPKPKKEPKADDAPMTKAEEKEQEEAEQMLEQKKKDKLMNRVKEYKYSMLVQNIRAKMSHTGKTALATKAIVLWDMLRPKDGYAWDGRAEELLKKIGCTRKGGGWGDWTNAVKKISELKEAELDEYIVESAAWRVDTLDKHNIEPAAEILGFDIKKDWIIDEAYLNMHTKDQLVELDKELKLNTEGTDGKKGESVKAILKANLKGKTPKAMQHGLHKD